MNKVIGELNLNDEILMALSEKGNEKCIYSTAVAFTTKYGNIVQVHAGDLFSKSYVDPEQGKILLERQRVVYVGDYVRGGLGIDGNIEIKFRPEILKACSPYLPEFKNPELLPVLRKLAADDLKAKKTDNEK